MAANMYRVGDYVFFENSSSNPYLIRRIEELNKTASGNVEAKVVCFYRRRDISSSLIALADKHSSKYGCLFVTLKKKKILFYVHQRGLPDWMSIHLVWSHHEVVLLEGYGLS
uniref:BAH domain-containing protein n=1 Tax=Eptatretus burgeri TaxID=7764 RepID=A0A8C4QLN0_EPTBU